MTDWEPRQITTFKRVTPKEEFGDMRTAVADSSLQEVVDREQALPQIAPENVYASSDEFVALMRQARDKGLESLSKSQQGQISAAIENGIIQQSDIEKGSFIDPQLVSYSFEMAKKMKTDASSILTDGSVSAWPGYTKVTKAIGEVLAKADQFMGQSNETLSNILGVKRNTGKTISELLGETFTMMGLDPIEPGEHKIELPIKDAKTGKPVEKTVKITKGQALAENLVAGAIRFLPEMTVEAADNPYALMKGLATFPHDAAQTIMKAAAFGPYSDEEVNAARKEIVANPLGPMFLGMMAFGGLHNAEPIKTAVTEWTSKEKAKQVELKTAEKEEAQATALAEKEEALTKEKEAHEQTKVEAEANKMPDLSKPDAREIAVTAEIEAANKHLDTYPQEAPEFLAVEARLTKQIGELEAKRAGYQQQREAAADYLQPEKAENVSRETPVVEKAPVKPVEIPEPPRSKYGEVKHDAIPDDLMVESEAVRARTGEKVKFKEPAKKALDQINIDIETWKKLINCLNT